MVSHPRTDQLVLASLRNSAADLRFGRLEQERRKSVEFMPQPSPCTYPQRDPPDHYGRHCQGRKAGTCHHWPCVVIAEGSMLERIKARPRHTVLGDRIAITTYSIVFCILGEHPNYTVQTQYGVSDMTLLKIPFEFNSVAASNFKFSRLRLRCQERPCILRPQFGALSKLKDRSRCAPNSHSSSSRQPQSSSSARHKNKNVPA
jgi:hypothetical protein